MLTARARPTRNQFQNIRLRDALPPSLTRVTPSFHLSSFCGFESDDDDDDGGWLWRRRRRRRRQSFINRMTVIRNQFGTIERPDERTNERTEWPSSRKTRIVCFVFSAPSQIINSQSLGLTIPLQRSNIKKKVHFPVHLFANMIGVNHVHNGARAEVAQILSHLIP